MRATLQINKRTCLLLTFVLVSILSFFYLYVSDESITIPLVHDLRQARQCQMITKIEDKSTKKTIDNKLAPLDDFDSFPCVSGAFLTMTGIQELDVYAGIVIWTTEKRTPNDVCS